MKNSTIKTCILLGLGLVISFSACKRDEYYIDGGKANPNFDGTMLEYLQSKPVPFDTIAQIVKLAGLEDLFNKEDMTFFAPTDYEVKQLIGVATKRTGLNGNLYIMGKDTVKTLADIDGFIWAKYLKRHLFKGAKKLADYPQYDPTLEAVYPGQNYYSYGNSLSRIGAVYGDVNGVKYIGYRQLTISLIPDVSRPDDNFFSYRVSSSDIKPKNGVVHSLELSGFSFGLSSFEMINEIVNQ